MFDRNGAVRVVSAAGSRNRSALVQQQQQRASSIQPDSPARQEKNAPQVFPRTERLYMLDTYLMSAGEIPLHI